MPSVKQKFPAQQAFAKRLGITQQRLSVLMAEADWPAGRKGWSEADAKKVERWRQERKEQSDQPDAKPESMAEAIRAMGPEKQLKLKLLAARVTKLETEQKLVLKTYLPREEVERERVSRIHAVKAELMNPSRLLAALEGCTTAAERETAVLDWAKGICQRFAGETASNNSAPSMT